MIQSNMYLIFMWILMYTNLICLIFKSNLSIIQTVISLMMFTVSTTLIMSNSSWSIYSFLIFLMIIGGLMILFMLFISLISNQYSMFSWKNLSMMMVLIMLLMLMKFLDLKIFNFNQINMNNFIDLSIQNQNLHAWMNINQLFMYSNNLFIIMLIMFLLIILFSITKICLTNIKPLRMTKK